MKTLGYLSILALLLFSACDGSDGERNSHLPQIPFTQISQQLADQGIDLIASVDNATTARPALFIGGLTAEDSIAAQAGAELGCRESFADSIYRVKASDAGGKLIAPGVLEASLTNAIQSLAAAGIREVVVLGHNTGGVIARRALATQPLPDIEIDLVTFFSPFGGVPSADAPAGYPAELLSESDYIQNPGALPGNVTHRKIVIDIARTSLLSGGADADGIFFASQNQAAVDSDPRLSASATIQDRFWPFGFDVQLRNALDEAGLPPNGCADAPAAVNALKLISGSESSAGPSSYTAGEAPSNVNFDPVDFAASGLQAPTLPGGAIDPSKPVIVMIHGVNGESSHFDKLEAEESKSHNVFRFVYDKKASALVGPAFDGVTEGFASDTDDLEELADKFADAVIKLRDEFGITQVTVVAHSMGGLIARRAMVLGRNKTLANSGIEVTFLSVGTPYGGFFFANFNPLFWLSETTYAPGVFYARVASGSTYITAPGSLGSNIHMVKVELLEKGDDFAVSPSDQVLNPENQSNPVVDSDPQLIQGSGFGGGIVSLKAGHVGALTNAGSVQAIVGLISQAEDASFGGGVDPGDTPPAVGGFICPDGIYTNAGGSCGVPNVTLSSATGTPTFAGFPANSPIPFSEGDADTRTATEIVILGKGGHTCTVQCTSAAVPEIVLTCTNAAGGKCTETLRGG